MSGWLLPQVIVQAAQCVLPSPSLLFVMTTAAASVTVRISDEALAELRSLISVRGFVVAPSELDYEMYRASWNHAYTAQPPLIIVAASTADVVAAVKWCRRHQLAMSVAGGRHSRHSLNAFAVQLNLAAMRAVLVSVAAKTVTVQGGARNGDLDVETAVYQLATPAGINSDTGCGGLILGGGNGFLTRKCGYACDNLVAAQVVTADGAVVECSADSNADLLWALKGAGFNFGVVTAMTLQLHSVAHVYKAMLTAEEEAIATQFNVATDQSSLVGKCVLFTKVLPAIAAKFVLPTLSRISHADTPIDRDLFFEAELVSMPDGTSIQVVLAGYLGADIYAGFRLANELSNRLVANVPADVPTLSADAKLLTYNELQNMLLPMTQPGHWYERSVVLDVITSDVAELITDTYINRPPSNMRMMMPCVALGGHSFAQEVDPESAAFNPKHRTASFWLVMLTPYDPHKFKQEEVAQWSDAFKAKLQPHVHSYFANTIMEGEQGRDLFGTHWERLRQLKREWDPTNFFRFNNNIAP